MAATVLMSIKPRFARAILAGTKPYELRRFVPRFAAGDRVLVYASSPERQVVGAFEVGRVESGTPRQVWAAIGEERSGLPASGFFAYLSGATRCAAIEVLRPRPCAPFALPLRPPQSYQFLHPGRPEHRQLLELAQDRLAAAGRDG